MARVNMILSEEEKDILRDVAEASTGHRNITLGAKILIREYTERPVVKPKKKKKK